MKYVDLVGVVAEKCGLTKALTRRVLNAAFEELGKASARGRVSIPGFGVFQPSTRAARQVVNPLATDERLALPRSYSVKFHAARDLRGEAATAARGGGRAKRG